MKQQLGNYVLAQPAGLSEDDPVVAEIKQVLQAEIDGIGGIEDVHWILDPYYLLVDPETGEACEVTCVAWKGWKDDTGR